MAERIIALIAGESGVGKSFFVANLSNALIYDTDIGGGLAYADARIAKNNSERIEAYSYPEILDDLKRRQLDNRLWVVIDHLSTLQQEGVNRHNPTMESDFGRSGEKAAREWRRIREFCRVHDFNLICCAHLKAKWESGEVVGTTAEASKNIEGDFMQVLHVRRGSPYPGTAFVQKWRRDPDDPRGKIPSSFKFTVENFMAIVGDSALAAREPVPLADTTQLTTLEKLLDVVKLPEGTVEKWFKKAGVDSFEEMTFPDVTKCIEYVQKLLGDATKPKKGKPNGV